MSRVDVLLGEMEAGYCWRSDNRTRFRRARRAVAMLKDPGMRRKQTFGSPARILVKDFLKTGEPDEKIWDRLGGWAADDERLRREIPLALVALRAQGEQ